MSLQNLIILLTLTIFKTEGSPLKILQVNQRKTQNYEVFKDILIQNLIVTTDNLKVILNWERENTAIRLGNEDIRNKPGNYEYNIFDKPTYGFGIKQNKNAIKDVKEKFINDKGEVFNVKEDFGVKKYLSKRSQELDKSEKEDTDELQLMNDEENYENLNNSNEESLLNDDNVLEEGKVKRQADGGDGGIISNPVTGGDTQMFMGTFQAVMRPMKLPGVS